MTAWLAEGLNRSKWRIRHRGRWNMAIQVLGSPTVKELSPAALVDELRRRCAAGPDAVLADALRHVADFLEARGGPAVEVDRLHRAAGIIDARELGMPELADQLDKEKLPWS